MRRRLRYKFAILRKDRLLLLLLKRRAFVLTDNTIVFFFLFWFQVYLYSGI